MTGDIKVEIDWDKNGDYSGTGENVTARVRGRISPVNLSFGRDLSSAFAPSVAGRGGFVLDNRSRDYTSRNSASPLYGHIKPARPVLVTRNYDAVGLDGDAETDVESDVESGVAATFTLFNGHTDDQPLNPDVSAKNVTLSLVDWLADFRGQNISTPLYEGIRSGDAIGYVLDHCNWTGGRDIDHGGSIFPWWWEDGTDALDALEKIVRSEGPPALITIGVDGEFIFRDRHHRLRLPASNTAQDTLTSGATGNLNLPFTVDEAWRNIINSGQIAVDSRTMQTPEHVWTFDGLITMQAGEVRTYTASASDPFVNAVAPIVTRDYTLLSGSVATSLNRTSGGSVTITLTATGATIIQDLKLQAQLMQVANTTQVTDSNGTSIDDYGPRSFPNDLPWAGVRDVEAILGLAIDMHAQPLPVVQARFVIVNSRLLGEPVLTRDLSDRVHIIESESMLDADFYLESISHQFTSEFDHEVTFELEAVPDSEPDSSTIIILGLDEPGRVLGTGVLVA